ncbi:hypothetical protein TRVL_06389 [Trypanosoma vivax]|nr:hypothetical protein TRVL_06389 [Trypanosoma vivax]
MGSEETHHRLASFCPPYLFVLHHTLQLCIARSILLNERNSSQVAPLGKQASLGPEVCMTFACIPFLPKIFPLHCRLLLFYCAFSLVTVTQKFPFTAPVFSASLKK